MKVKCNCGKWMKMVENMHNENGTFTMILSCPKCQVQIEIVLGMKWKKNV